MKFGLERVLMVVCLCVVVTACGVKAPPIAPTDKKPGIVSGLEHHVTGSELTLNWNSAQEPVDRYVVYRSRVSMNQEPCEGCPVIFERVADLPGDSVEYHESLEGGYRYVYKVLARTSSGLESERGMHVRFAL